MAKRYGPSTYKVGTTAGRDHTIELSSTVNDRTSVFSLVVVVGNEALITTSGEDHQDSVRAYPKALAGLPFDKVKAWLSKLEADQVAKGEAASGSNTYGDVSVIERYFGVRTVEQVKAEIEAMA
jgi:hypothetical protein